jgi:hypothetical protein
MRLEFGLTTSRMDEEIERSTSDEVLNSATNRLQPTAAGAILRQPELKPGR